MQARNALCPGITTFVENAFQTFNGGNNRSPQAAKGGSEFKRWTTDYIRGAEMEVCLSYLNNVILL